MRALVTGFEPFGGDALNASGEAVRRLPSRVGRIEVAVAILPVSFARSHTALEEAIARTAPELVLCVGEAADRAAINIERIAVNLQDAGLADNDGVRPVDRPVIPGAPAAYFSALPVRAIFDALAAEGLPVEISNSAGTFVCNHVFYRLMHHAATRPDYLAAGFLHVPCLPQQVKRRPDASCLPLEDIVRGIEIALSAAGARKSP